MKLMPLFSAAVLLSFLQLSCKKNENPVTPQEQVAAKVQMSGQEAGISSLTTGWTLTPYTYTIQTPHDLPQSDRYTYSGGQHTFWIYPDDSPHTPTSNTGPRSEFRMKNDYLLGKHQFEGDVYIVPGSTGTDVMQVFGGVSNSTSFMMKVFSANNGTLKRYGSQTLMTNVYNRWIHVNVQHDADNGKIYVYLDNAHVGTFDDRGQATHYFKCGTYNIEGNRSETRWKNIKYWKNGPIGVL
ncbi:Alginate lyase [Pedobacter steynii]|uniref:Alginate lyase n=1 Tax=Pedobacter steynii TaxID=430522 RepID=A0A1H0HT92_9SPHI|nr:polysaccharide lyase family 7 protein [Pedobacter steynii]NQX42521.1 polysaccharide lyase family 7 protein [Pedobacter steynii]SDO22011.1 Alginate lyase [Pedobacter steynii]